MHSVIPSANLLFSIAKDKPLTGTLSKNHSALKPMQTCPIRLSGCVA